MNKHEQDWFSECAFLISRVRNNPVKWKTPLGLFVSQPYFTNISVYKEDVSELLRLSLTNKNIFANILKFF